MALYTDQSTRMTANGARGMANNSERAKAREFFSAFDDDELCSWLMTCIEDGSENFLCAVAEAAVAATDEDYVVIRPALLALKRRHRSRSRFTEVRSRKE